MPANEELIAGSAPTQSASVGSRREVAELLRRLGSDLQEVSRDFGGRHEMNASDVRAIVLVLDAQRQGREIGPSGLAEGLGMTGAAMTALVDRLEKVGHLYRRPDPTDRRRVTLHVGTDAQRLGGEYFGGLQQRINAATEDFSQSDMDAVRRYLQATITAVEDHMADGR